MSENEGKADRKTSKLTPSYIEVILIVLIVVSGAIYGYDRYFAQKFMVVDIGGYLRQQKALLAAGEITGDDLKAGLDKIDRLVSQQADQHKNHIIILKEVVLKNGKELSIK